MDDRELGDRSVDAMVDVGGDSTLFALKNLTIAQCEFLLFCAKLTM